MIRSLYTAATGMMAQQTQIDVTSNNIANVNTIGYKKQRAEFADLFYQVMEYAGVENGSTQGSPTGIEIGLGSRPTAVVKQFTQGNFKESGNSFDLAITGNGFFQLQMPDGTISYTRNGAFKVDGNGTIVNSDGLKMVPEITIPENVVNTSIAADGTVSVILAGETEPQQVGKIELANFINPAGLHSLGDNNYQETVASGNVVTGTAAIEGFGAIRQGFVEMSNVQLVEEMTDLITGQRAYEANSKAVTTSDEMLQTVNQLKR
ncbi:MAG TPA: flagellar basal-body rod protein FlgG [Campylobacterales bacterium]|nr:flagellar basal-body rod protein FlgG [Campylobacterales bacterium]